MRIVRFEIKECIRYGVLRGEDIQVLSGNPFDDANTAVALTAQLTEESCRLERVSLLAPCEPSKYIGIGINYRATAEALNFPVPERPILFLKPPSAVIGPDQNIVLPKSPVKVVCEGELAVVISRRCKNISEKEAPSHILGYTITNDVTDASKFESDSGNPTRAKVADTFGPLGPWIETELDPRNLTLKTYINGQQAQHGTIGDLIFSINYCLSFISHLMTLLPGDIIATGTPQAPAEVKPGDLVEVKVDGIGTLKNGVVGLPQGPHDEREK
ncbi:MAG: fumarylacetoacetate hydrolase family protein [Gammaproteobacteria bacterium]|nr:fumarylacetoacetate hydrolase family protein [Gammaproteobacteria bacterium]